MEPLKYLYVYLTDDCNLQCSHCWQDAPMAGGHRTTFLDFDRTKPFLDEARRLGLQAVNLSGGEPMLSPDFCDFINYFGEHGIQCAIETNGMLISGPRLDAIRRHRPLCAVSIDGFSPETHNRQRGRDDAFEQTVRGIERLEGSQIPFELVMSVSRVNLNELEPLLERVAKDWHACRIFKINIVSPQGRGEKTCVIRDFCSELTT
jgi:MoaA/NifB/PqqE/SkfB family radical SAM enzyme